MKYPDDSLTQEMLKKDKELYNTNIIQSMLERISELEDKVERLEKK